LLCFDGIYTPIIIHTQRNGSKHYYAVGSTSPLCRSTRSLALDLAEAILWFSSRNFKCNNFEICNFHINSIVYLHSNYSFVINYKISGSLWTFEANFLYWLWIFGLWLQRCSVMILQLVFTHFWDYKSFIHKCKEFSDWISIWRDVISI
jgi:hypothetical protein